MAMLLGLSRQEDYGQAEPEEPVGLMLVTAGNNIGGVDAKAVESLAKIAAEGNWSGAANVLSYGHEYTWTEGDKVETGCVKPVTVETPWSAPAIGAVQQCGCDDPAADVIRKRRSAQAFDGKTVMPEEVFYRMLDATLPRYGAPPWDALSWSPRIHLAMFVHRVEGLVPGIYTLLRREGVFPKLRSAMLPQFDWIRPDNAPPHLPVFRLAASDERRMAQMVSCHQDIASESVLSLGMLAEFGSSLTQGAWWYRRMFWEAGMVGQVLYLEAEAAGLRGTGIGCFFDDSFHELLGLRGTDFQSLYHFTVGGPIEDTRLDTLPPYYHLNGR